MTMALQRTLTHLCPQLGRSPAWDQGKEKADHATFTLVKSAVALFTIQIIDHERTS